MGGGHTGEEGDTAHGSWRQDLNLVQADSRARMSSDRLQHPFLLLGDPVLVLALPTACLCGRASVPSPPRFLSWDLGSLSLCGPIHTLENWLSPAFFTEEQTRRGAKELCAV